MQFQYLLPRIPVTHRGVTSTFVVASAHDGPAGVLAAVSDSPLVDTRPAHGRGQITSHRRGVGSDQEGPQRHRSPSSNPGGPMISAQSPHWVKPNREPCASNPGSCSYRRRCSPSRAARGSWNRVVKREARLELTNLPTFSLLARSLSVGQTRRCHRGTKPEERLGRTADRSRNL